MLAEYALIPDIFIEACYSSPELCRYLIGALKEPLLNEALVRNLRNGDWYRHLTGTDVTLSPMAKELLTKLVKQNRLRLAVSALSEAPDDYEKWCNEAISSNVMCPDYPLTGIIVSRNLKSSFKDNPLIESIERLSSATWWIQRSPSVRLRRQSDDYLKHLRLILNHANSLMFIDPHIDPTRPSYTEFIKLFQAIEKREIPPLIEIHRRCCEESGPNKKTIPRDEWERRFGGQFKQALNASGLSAEIFIWDDLHDRHLITDLIGINIPYGFDISRDPTQTTTWGRLGRGDRDCIQREFDKTSTEHTLQYTFTI